MTDIRRNYITVTIICLGTAAALGSCGESVNTQTPDPVVVPVGFPALPQPADNKLTEDRISLGKRLFYDTQLSRTGEVACASCHRQEAAFCDTNRFSFGVERKLGGRNAPALINLAYNTSFFWDGGVPTLEQQAIGPIKNPLEMDMALDSVCGRLKLDPQYLVQFKKAYDTIPTPGTLTRAIASFMRSLVSGNSRYDRFAHGDSTVMTGQEVRGKELFFGEKADCFHCHIGFNFTNNQFQNNGLYRTYADPGRMKITNNPIDEGKFKVPTLRNVELTAPYMHDGSLQTLEAVVDHYSSGGKGSPTTDPVIKPLNLTAQEKADLVAFLKTLTDSSFVNNPRYR